MHFQAGEQTCDTVLQQTSNLVLIFQFFIVEKDFCGDGGIHHLRIGPLIRLSKTIPDLR
ncbi:MAG: hypothetical protein ABI234_15315 [Ktedonobacteraceae bacterium]